MWCTWIHTAKSLENLCSALTERLCLSFVLFARCSCVMIWAEIDKYVTDACLHPCVFYLNLLFKRVTFEHHPSTCGCVCCCGDAAALSLCLLVAMLIKLIRLSGETHPAYRWGERQKGRVTTPLDETQKGSRAQEEIKWRHRACTGTPTCISESAGIIFHFCSAPDSKPEICRPMPKEAENNNKPFPAFEKVMLMYYYLSIHSDWN